MATCRSHRGENKHGRLEDEQSATWCTLPVPYGCNFCVFGNQQKRPWYFFFFFNVMMMMMMNVLWTDVKSQNDTKIDGRRRLTYE